VCVLSRNAIQPLFLFYVELSLKLVQFKSYCTISDLLLFHSFDKCHFGQIHLNVNVKCFCCHFFPEGNSACTLAIVLATL